MPDIVVSVRRFENDYAALNGERRITVSRREILWAALTLGFQDSGGFWAAGMREWLRRVCNGISAVTVTNHQGENLTVFDGYEDLDGSEMGCQSYSLGMIFAKIVANKVLNIPWLGHVDAMKKQELLQTDSTTKSRGDMVGLCRERRWHVIEAKGRSGTVAQTFVQEAKDQAARVQFVCGEVPVTTSACVTLLQNNPIKVILDDPPPDGAVSWMIKDDQFSQFYYGSLTKYLREYRTPLNIKSVDEEYDFAPFAPILELLPTELWELLSPLPDYIGLPKGIVEDPSGGQSLILNLRELPILNASLDGVVLLGPLMSTEGKELGDSY